MNDHKDEPTAFEIELQEINKRLDWIESLLKDVADRRRANEAHDEQS